MTRARSAFISGVPMYCGASITDPITYDHLRDCSSMQFTPTSEVWDAIDQCVVGQATCDGCGASWLYTRRPTREEAMTLVDAPQHLVLLAGIDWL